MKTDFPRRLDCHRFFNPMPVSQSWSRSGAPQYFTTPDVGGPRSGDSLSSNDLLASVLGPLATPFTPMDQTQGARIAADLYGLTGSITRFATEKDDTFRIQTDDGRLHVLKIANPDESFDELDLQVAAMTHVAGKTASVPVPRVFPDRNGRLISETVDDSGARRHVRLMSFLPGTVLDSTTSSAGERDQIGRVLGQLRLAMGDFRHPHASRPLAWDVRHLMSLAPLLDSVPDATQRHALEQGLARFAALEERVHRLPRQVLHNDFSCSNIVVDHQSPAFVVGIIDFGDTVETAIAIDVSTALLNQLPRDAAIHPVDDLFAQGKDVLRGYLAVAPLTDDERALIPHLVMARVIGRALLSLWRAKMFPENMTYILRNTEQGWAQLDWFLRRSPDAVSAALL